MGSSANEFGALDPFGGASPTVVRLRDPKQLTNHLD